MHHPTPPVRQPRSGFFRAFLLLTLVSFCAGPLRAQTPNHSVARQWNDQLLEAIRNDFARPVVHARNLYHISAAMYDCWSIVHDEGTPAFFDGERLPLDRSLLPEYADRSAAAREATSYAGYRILKYRYRNAPGRAGIHRRADSLMQELGYDTLLIAQDYQSGVPAALGNYVAATLIDYATDDGANEADDYNLVEYPDPVNPPLAFTQVFSILQLQDPTRWQTLQFPGQIIDQSGNPVGDSLLPFLGAEWGRVEPFAMDEADREPADPDFQFGNNLVYHDPGPPPVFTASDTTELAEYRWNFETVLKWSGHLDPNDGVEWDISPGALGNLSIPYPTNLAEYEEFYLKEGGTAGANGHAINPITGEAYAPNIVRRGDYTRVLAEFWADGPASETPPGHWFDIFNGVMDHPLFERRLGGEGELLEPLEYDVKAYLALGGALHDAAISAWSIKGAYDYIRPISAIRWMAKNGQTSPNEANYSPRGLQLDPGYIEPLSAPGELENTRTLAQTQAWAWVGPEAINDPETDVAGVGWINPAMWYPYQRPNFVTPNFAGYISGHSTYSSAAAQVLEGLTGSPYFPGGLGEFIAKKDEFLVFEQGPSEDIVLQWATYRDASDQTSLSRIWGGIHPPVDDIPGREIGIVVGTDAIEKAFTLFETQPSSTGTPVRLSNTIIYPNPVPSGGEVTIQLPPSVTSGYLELIDIHGRPVGQYAINTTSMKLPVTGLRAGLYVIRTSGGATAGKLIIL